MISTGSIATDSKYPLVSIVIPTHNRANTIERTIRSVLQQTYSNIELIIIDDGSTDNTLAVLHKYHNPALRIFRHEKNQGAASAKNSGLKRVQGQWFTILDSDDEIEPHAIETMMKIPLLVDPSVTAVTCNCWDTTTCQFSGKGLSQDQYVDVSTLMTVCKGEFWGITSASLLDDKGFNERIVGFENILWYQINEKAKRYYVHAPLRIYHTEGTDRIRKTKYSFKREVALFENLIDEHGYLDTIRKYRPTDYFLLCRNGVIVMRAGNRKDLASRYYELSKQIGRSFILDLSYRYKLLSIILRRYKTLKYRLRSYLYPHRHP